MVNRVCLGLFWEKEACFRTIGFGVFTSLCSTGHLLNWSQVATIKQSRKHTTRRLCNTFCSLVASRACLANAQVLSLAPCLSLMFSLSFCCSQSDQQDQAWNHQEGKQAAHTYRWTGKSLSLFIQPQCETRCCIFIWFKDILTHSLSSLSFIIHSLSLVTTRYYLYCLFLVRVSFCSQGNAIRCEGKQCEVQQQPSSWLVTGLKLGCRRERGVCLSGLSLLISIHTNKLSEHGAAWKATGRIWVHPKYDVCHAWGCVQSRSS